MTTLDGINGRLIQTLLTGENDSKQLDEFQAKNPLGLEESVKLSSLTRETIRYKCTYSY